MHKFPYYTFNPFNQDQGVIATDQEELLLYMALPSELSLLKNYEKVLFDETLKEQLLPHLNGFEWVKVSLVEILPKTHAFIDASIYSPRYIEAILALFKHQSVNAHLHSLALAYNEELVTKAKQYEAFLLFQNQEVIGLVTTRHGAVTQYVLAKGFDASILGNLEPLLMRHHGYAALLKPYEEDDAYPSIYIASKV